MEDYIVIDIDTDGSAAPNPGPGGFGVVAVETKIDGKTHQPIDRDIIYTHSCAAKEKTTNNREEIKAMIDALHFIDKILRKRFRKENFYAIYIHCDSSYVVNTCTIWIDNWQKNNWKTDKNEEVKNADLMRQLYDALHNYRTQFGGVPAEEAPFTFAIGKVKGHDKVAGNELADALATKNEKKISEWYEKVLAF